MASQSSKKVNLKEIVHRPNEDLIKHLEGLLGEAKKGKLRSLFEVCLWPGGYVSSGWSYDPKVSMLSVIGQLRVLEQQLISNWDLIEKS